MQRLTFVDAPARENIPLCSKLPRNRDQGASIMGIFSAMFTSLKRATTGKILKQIDTPIGEGACTISLRLKQNKNDTYVVLAGIASGNYQYYPMSRDEFELFASAVKQIQEDLREG
jgi:hypothetical protein